MASGGGSGPRKFRVGTQTLWLVRRRDVLHIHDREDAQRLLDRIADDDESAASLRSSVAELGLDTPSASDDDVRTRARDLLVSGRMVLVRLSDAMPPLGSVSAPPLLHPDAPGDVPYLDAPEDPSPEVTTWFQARVVDGEAIPLVGVPVIVDHGTSRADLVTDGDGIVRLDGVTSTRATLTIPRSEELDEALVAAWSRPATRQPLTAGPRCSVVHVRGENTTAAAIDAEAPHTVSVQPFVVLGRMLGMFFDTDRSFPLPPSRDAIAEMRALYDRCTPCTVLVVGHTDTTGQVDHNATLSLARAERVAEYLTDDVDAWLGQYESSIPSGVRWGEAEDLCMLTAMDGFEARAPGDDLVRWFQRTRGLTDDGDLGPVTRRALIGEYMAVDGTTLPPGVQIRTHGCGEAFPLDASGHELDEAPKDDAGDPIDRRVEFFFFAGRLGVLPVPADTRSMPETTDYPTWRWRAQETYEKVLGAQALEIELRGEDGQPLAHAAYTITLPVGATIEGTLDEQGCARLEHLPPGDCLVDFPELARGFTLTSSSRLPG